MHRSKFVDYLVHSILIVACLCILLPLIWVIRTSLVQKVVAYQIPPEWLALPSLENYVHIFTEKPFHLYFFNSFYIAVMTSLVSLVIGSLAAYSFSRFRTGGDLVRVSILSTQMLPVVTLVIPFFLLARVTNLLHTRTLMVVVYLTISLPFVIWILIGFFQGIPRELEESAMIDGCSRMTAFVRVIVPISLPGVLSAGLFSFVLVWNEFIFALILTGTGSRTLPVALSALLTQRGLLVGPLCAGIVLIMVPMVGLYFFMKNFLARGLTLGALK